MRPLPRTRMPALLAATIGLCLAAAGAPAQEAKPLTVLRYANAAPQASVWGMQTERWGRAVEEASEGTLRIDLFLGGQLGADADLVQQVARGRLDVAGVGMGFLPLIAPEVQLLMLPFFFRSPAETDCALDRHLGAAIDARLAAKGVKLVGWGEGGTLDFAGKRAFTSPADIAGVKAGTLGTRAMQIMWQALGANPTVLTFLDIPAAFQAGLIDVAPTVPVMYVSQGLNKVAPVLSRIALFHGSWASIVHKPTWDRLTPGQRAAFARADARIPLHQTRQEVRAYQQQVIEAHLKGGGQVLEPTAPQREAFRQAIAPHYPRMVEAAGPDGPAFYALMEAARQACATAN